MKVLVVGGAGYIGSHVVMCLLEAGHEVTVFDNLSSGKRENLFDQADFFEGDLLDQASLKGCISRGFDAAIHLAAFKAAGESMIEPEKYSVNNITGTINLLNALIEGGVKGVVFSSSAAVFGEPSYLPLDEDHPKNPTNYYGFTKLEIERLMGWYDRLKGLKFAALRYFNAAGYDPAGRVKGLESNPANLLPVIMEVAAGTRESLKIFGDDYATPDGTGVRDYVHVNDLADAHVRALEYILEKGESLTVNLGSGDGLSVKQIVELSREHTGRPVKAEMAPRRAGDPARLVASSERAKELLGWEPRFSDGETLVVSSWKAYEKTIRP